MAPHPSILAWEIPWTEEPGGLQFMHLQGIKHDWSDLTCTDILRKSHNFPLKVNLTVIVSVLLFNH